MVKILRGDDLLILVFEKDYPISRQFRKKGRFKRAERINLALIKAGLPSMLERALLISGGKGQIGRVHFARAMVQENICEDVRDVFSSYLVKGKPGYVEHHWPSLKNVVSLICHHCYNEPV